MWSWMWTAAWAALDPRSSEIPVVLLEEREGRVEHTWHAGDDPGTLVVLLPGIFADGAMLRERGVLEAMREAGLQADVVTVDAHLRYYMDRSISRRLVDEILAPVRGQYENIWVVGISLGGLGGLLTVRDAPEVIDGLVLLSPWLGRPRPVREVRDDGGLGRWRPVEGKAWEYELWSWLAEEHARGWSSASIHLGYGSRDLLVDNHHTLAEALGPERVTRVDGGHSWATWRTLAYDVTLTLKDEMAKVR